MAVKLLRSQVQQGLVEIIPLPSFLLKFVEMTRALTRTVDRSAIS